MAANKNLHNAKAAKNDEFYTRLSDIENELKNYKSHFANKVIYCNCDDPEWSNFYLYFKKSFSHLNIKKLITTHYSGNNKSDTAYKMECFKDENGELKEVKTNLKSNGDFRSDECIELLKESDIVCTNPPFSLFRIYIDQLQQHNKDFLIIGPQNAVTYKEFFSPLRENKIWLGINHVKEFLTPDKETVTFGNICWYTNIQHQKRNEKLILWKKYNSTEFPEYDNYQAIHVNKISNIPIDYDGYMAVPITFLNKYNPDQFEIANANNIRKNQTTPAKAHGLIKDTEATINGKATYVRIVIKRKDTK